jgi:hypothetical protein
MDTYTNLVGMNKTQAAAYLGKSIHTLEQYLRKKKLTADYVPGVTGMVADFSQEKLEAFKARYLNAVHNPAVTVETAPAGAPAPVVTVEVVAVTPAPAVAPALAVEPIPAPVAVTPAPVHAAPVVGVADKLVLSVAEASALSGIPRARLHRAIVANGLKASREWGRGWKVKRADLVLWVGAL